MTNNLDKVLLRFADSIRHAETRHLADSFNLDFDIDISFDEGEVLEDLAYGRDEPDEELPDEVVVQTSSSVRRLALELS